MTARTDQPDNPLPTPNGRRWCGLADADHYRRWKPPVGWHGWTPPTDEQRKQRMLDRRRRAGCTARDAALLLCG